jgi:hypothetical protein
VERKSTLAFAITSHVSTSKVHLAVSFGRVSSNVELVLFVNYGAGLLPHELFDKRDPKSALAGT